MKVLVLEDDKERIEWFQSIPDIDTLHITMSVEILKNWIVEKYDLIFLDHDLDDRVFVDSNEPNTGYQAAKSIVNSINKDTPVIIHTCNPVGADNIKAILKHGEVVPFPLLKIRLTK